MSSHLEQLLPPDQLHDLLKSTAVLNGLRADIRPKVVEVFANGFSLQMKITTVFAALQLAAIAMIWKKRQIAVVEKK